MIAVVNVRKLPTSERLNVVYVGRHCAGWKGHALANPFKLSRGESDRVACLARYRAWLTARTTLEADLAALWAETEQGRLPLGCWCKPDECHADVLAEILTDRFGAVPGNQTSSA